MPRICPLRARAARLLFGALCTCLLTLPAAGAGFDPFGTDALVSNSPTHALGTAQAPACAPACAPARADQLVTLALAIDMALCSSAQTQKDWATAKAMAAQLGAAKASYLPSINASATSMREKDSTRVEAYPDYNNDINSRTRSARVDMSLVLYDFGARAANVDGARALLDAANAAHDAGLQAAFIGAAQTYYDALTATSHVVAARSAQQLGEQTYKSAEARHRLGLATLVEKLQAETASAQETLKLIKAEGALQIALGNLADTIGLPINTPLQLDTSESERAPDTTFVKAVDTLMEEAKTRHPHLIAARAQLRAAEAGERAARASGYPTLSASFNKSGATQPTTQLGLPPLTTSSRGMQIGFQLNIPLFDGFARSYRIRSAHAQTAVRAADLAELESQVAMGVWKNYQALHTATAELKVSQQFRASAAQTVEAAQGRNKLGAAPILELLNAQATLAAADQQKIQAMADWRTARLRLAFNLGILGHWALQ
ncbi:MAG: TolC family protein [Pseudomonadota bacterium]